MKPNPFVALNHFTVPTAISFTFTVRFPPRRRPSPLAHSCGIPLSRPGPSTVLVGARSTVAWRARPRRSQWCPLRTRALPLQLHGDVTRRRRALNLPPAGGQQVPKPSRRPLPKALGTEFLYVQALTHAFCHVTAPNEGGLGPGRNAAPEPNGWNSRCAGQRSTALSERFAIRHISVPLFTPPYRRRGNTGPDR